MKNGDASGISLGMVLCELLSLAPRRHSPHCGQLTRSLRAPVFLRSLMVRVLHRHSEEQDAIQDNNVLDHYAGHCALQQPGDLQSRALALNHHKQSRDHRVLAIGFGDEIFL